LGSFFSFSYFISSPKLASRALFSFFSVFLLYYHETRRRRVSRVSFSSFTTRARAPFFFFKFFFIYLLPRDTSRVYIYIFIYYHKGSRRVSRALLVYFCTYSTTTRHVASRGFIKINFYHLVVQGLEMRVSSPFDFFLVFFSSFFFTIY
jgi:hypothetical protein